ncbi:hypothetical protein [Burkholderia guangdongensis]|uniref:hypothetical protein n=1 Tax=Burkholderia guangdongensis TaxID=1792500 RepID=UPI0015CDDAC1|nr:hypothetical protein [Burkholderia guangdongensis]
MTDTVDQAIASAEGAVVAAQPLVQTVGTVVAAVDPSAAPAVAAVEAVASAAPEAVSGIAGIVAALEVALAHLKTLV